MLFISSSLPVIQWIKCENGLWEDRQNLAEARLVTDLIKKQLVQNKIEGAFRTMGVITFPNETQKVAILDEIESRKKSDPEFYESTLRPKTQSQKI